MRVVCIKTITNNIITNEKGNFGPKKGDVVTPIETIKGPDGGDYYKLLEYEKYKNFSVENFVTINEDQQDETEMDRNYNTQHA